MDGFAYFSAKTSQDRFGWKQGEAQLYRPLHLAGERTRVTLRALPHIHQSSRGKKIGDDTERHWKPPSNQGGTL